MSEAKRIPHNKQDINEQFIIDNYMTMTSFEIAEALGVSRSTINGRIRTLGLRKTSLPFATKSIVEKIVNNTRWKHLERATTSRKA